MRIENEEIEQVEYFKYLRHTISSKGDQEKAVNERICLGWAAYSKTREILESSRVSIHIKRKIIEAFIFPVVSYGLECTTWNKKLVQKIKVFRNNLMRRIANTKISDKVSINSLEKLTRMPSLFQLIKDRKIQLFKTTKESVQGLAKVCFEGKIEGKRSRGRPRRKWVDDLKDWYNTESVFDLHGKIKEGNSV